MWKPGRISDVVSKNHYAVARGLTLVQNFMDLTTEWLNNSSYAPFEYYVYKKILLWIFFGIAVLIIMHSFVLHQKKRHKIRTFTELTSIIVVCVVVLLHVAGSNPKSHFIVVFYQSFWVYGILGCSIQIIDNYFVYSLYEMLTASTLPFRIFVHFYIWTNFMTYFLFVSLFPFFLNLSDEPVSKLYIILGSYCWTGLYLGFNAFFLCSISYLLYQKYCSSEIYKMNGNKVILVFYRSIYHLILR